MPYLMSSHPGSTLRDAVELALFLKQEKLRPEQVQDFYPTPGTISTCMFYTGLDPYTLKEVHIPRTDREKAMQRALLQYFDPKNHRIVVGGPAGSRPSGSHRHRSPLPGPSPAGRSNPRAGYEAERGREIGMEPQKGLPSAAEKPRRKTKKIILAGAGGCPVPIGPAVWDLLRPAGLGKGYSAQRASGILRRRPTGLHSCSMCWMWARPMHCCWNARGISCWWTAVQWIRA